MQMTFIVYNNTRPCASGRESVTVTTEIRMSHSHYQTLLIIYYARENTLNYFLRLTLEKKTRYPNPI